MEHHIYSYIDPIRHAARPSPIKEKIMDWATPLFKIHRPRFEFEGKSYRYFWHPYNRTGRSERTVEIPLALDAVRSCSGRILEVGNVLCHYASFEHDVLDKYDTSSPSNLNRDAASFRPKKRYDLIVSVSTLEHVGWDEKPKDPAKAVRAIRNLVSRCLASGGQFFATIPVGYNGFLDRQIQSGNPLFETEHFLKRFGKFNCWRQVERRDAAGSEYMNPYPFANALLIGITRSAVC